MNRLLKIIATVIALIVLIVIIAIVVMILFINPNRFKPLIIKQIYSATGRTLSMPGDISWSFFPTISITTASVTLSNPAGYSQAVFVHADSAKAEVRLFPLLSGNVEPKNIILSGGELYLIKNKQGEANWSQWGTAPSVQTANTATDTSSSTSSSFNIIIPNINIINTKVQYTDETTGQSFALNNLNLQAKKVNFNTPFPLTFNTDFASKNPDANGHINLNATIIYDKKSLTVNNIDLTGEVASPQTNNQRIPLNLSGNLSIGDNRFNLQPINLQIANFHANGYVSLTNISQTQYTGAINIKPFNACQFLSTFNIQTNCADTQVLKQVGFNTVFSGSKNTFDLNSFDAKIDNGSINGKFSLDNLSTKTGKFSLYLSHVNVDQYLNLLPQTTTNTDNTNTAQQQNTAIQLPPVAKAYNIAGNISAKDFTVNKLHLDSVETQLVSNYGFINLYPLEVGLYKGKLSGAISADFRPLQPAFNVRLTLEKVDLYPLLSDLFNFKNASGTLNFKTNITTHGANTQSLKEQLNGQANAQISNVALKNMDFTYYYQAGLALLRGEKSAASKTNATNVGSLNATFNIKNGIAQNDDLNFTSHDFTVTGTGTINLPNNTLDYLLHITDKQNNSIPLIASGPLSSPSVKIDVSQAIKQNAEKSLKNELNKQLKNGLNGLGW